MRTSPKLRQSAKRSYQELSNHFPEPEQPTSPRPRRLRARRSRALTLEINQCVKLSPEADHLCQTAPQQTLGVPQVGDLQAELSVLALHSKNDVEYSQQWQGWKSITRVPAKSTNSQVKSRQMVWMTTGGSKAIFVIGLIL